MKTTPKALRAFVARREKSQFDTNLQVNIDANGTGVNLDECEKKNIGSVAHPVYRMRWPGVGTVFEDQGKPYGTGRWTFKEEE